MKFADYQIEARKTAHYPAIGHTIIYPALGLAGEAGEVLDKIKKVFRDKDGDLASSRDELIKELGDVMWYLSALCDELDTTMDAVAQINVDKLRSRQERGQLGGEGDNR